RPARIPAAAVVPHRPAAPSPGRPLFLGHHERLRPHVRVRHAGSAGGPVGHHGLHPRAPAEPQHFARGTARRGSAAIDGSGRPMNAPAVLTLDAVRPDATTTEKLDRLQRLGLIVGVAASVLFLFSFLQGAGSFFQSYLFGYLCWAAIAIGAIPLIMLQYLIN